MAEEMDMPMPGEEMPEPPKKQKGILSFGGHKKEQPQADLSGVTSDINSLSRRLRLLEEGSANIRNMLQITEENLVSKNKTIGILGLAFKPNTDDMRLAPSIDIINQLQKEGAKIKAYDPEAVQKAKEILNDVVYCNDPYDAAKDSDALVIVTEWKEVRDLDLNKIKTLMRHPLIIDGRNIYSPDAMKKEGFTYISIGRKDVL